MGDPRKQKKKYVAPKKPFDSDRFEQELQLIGSYGLRNKKELWKHKTDLSNYRRQARHLLALPVTEREKEERELVDKLTRLGMLTTEPTLDHVLDLTMENVLERRLQTVVFRKGLASSMHHARQLVTHGHIALDGARINTPRRMIAVTEESRINYSPKSALNDASHPARIAASDAATRASAARLEDADDYERPQRSDEKEPVTNEDIGSNGDVPNE
ncbi:MAG: 30S ribosomal protein S4 [Candidatus Thorarchaeota archaeon]|nr:30S ribosomal protein S4 [Candidatus Thorarchaeota archaeon]